LLEREITVRPEEVESIKRKLRKAGYSVVGIGGGEIDRTKIWFNTGERI